MNETEKLLDLNSSNEIMLQKYKEAYFRQLAKYKDAINESKEQVIQIVDEIEPLKIKAKEYSEENNNLLRKYMQEREEQKIILKKVESLNKELKDLQRQCKNVQTEIYPEDKQIIERDRLKFHYYKQLTGLRWDYNSPHPKGFITRKSNNYIHRFSYKGNSEKQLKEEIAKAYLQDWTKFLK